MQCHDGTNGPPLKVVLTSEATCVLLKRAHCSVAPLHLSLRVDDIMMPQTKRRIFRMISNSGFRVFASLVTARPSIEAVSMRHHRHAAVVHSVAFAMVARGMGLGSRGGDLNVVYGSTGEAREKVVKIGEFVQGISFCIHLNEVRSTTTQDTVQDNIPYCIGQHIAVQASRVVQLLYMQNRTERGLDKKCPDPTLRCDGGGKHNSLFSRANCAKYLQQ